MTATLIGYARCSTDAQDLTAQRHALTGLGVAADRIYLDKGLTGTNRRRPGLDQALAAVRAGDTLVVPKLDRLARSVPDARDIGDSLVAVAHPGGLRHQHLLRCARRSRTPQPGDTGESRSLADARPTQSQRHRLADSDLARSTAFYADAATSSSAWRR
jgi:Resolvase, N terminal domain